MKKVKLTKTESDYKRFDIASKLLLCGILAFAAFWGVLFILANTDETKALFGLFMAFVTVTIFIIAPKIAKRRSHYLELLHDERNTIVRSGIFKEVYDAYKYDGFEFNLTYDKLLYQEYCNNTIDIGVKKNGHEFLIEIDEQKISIIVDEKMESPLEKTFSLSEIESIKLLYETINAYIAENS